MNTAAREGRSLAVATLLTAAAQIVTLLGAAVLGVLVGQRFGAGARTDGFFTANAVYGLVLFVAQSLRTTTVGRLIAEGQPSPERLREHMAGVALLALAGAVLLAAIGLLGASHLVADGAADTFRTAMLLLAPAAALQLFSGLSAAMLAAYGDYARAAYGFAAGALGNVVGFLVLAPIAGIDGVAGALIVGSAVSAVIIGGALLTHERRLVAAVAPRAATTAASRILLGAMALVAAQFLLTVSVAFAGGVQTGGATVYTYAMMVIVMLNAALASPVGVVFAPLVARTWDGTPAALLPLTRRAYRTGTLLLPILVGGVVLLGERPTELVLTKVSSSDVSTIFELVPIIGVSLLAALLLTIPALGVFTKGRTGSLALGSAIVAVVHVGLCAIAVALDTGLEGLAVATVISSFGLSSAAVVLAFGRLTPSVFAMAARGAATIALPGAVAFGGAALALGFHGQLGRGALAFVIGLVAYGAFVVSVHRAELDELRAMVRR